jgi:hypothetical protein
MAKTPSSNSSGGQNPKPVEKPAQIPTGNVGTRSGDSGKTIKKWQTKTFGINTKNTHKLLQKLHVSLRLQA